MAPVSPPQELKAASPVATAIATRRTTLSSAATRARPQRFGSREIVIALGTWFPFLICDRGANFVVRQRSIANCCSTVPLQNGCLNSGSDELFLSMFADRSALWQFFRSVLAQSHMSDSPCVQRRFDCLRKSGARRALLFQK